MATVEWSQCRRCGPGSELVPFGICGRHLNIAKREGADPEHAPDNGDVGLLGMGGNRREYKDA
jgi:hypothetical protein